MSTPLSKPKTIAGRVLLIATFHGEPDHLLHAGVTLVVVEGDPDYFPDGDVLTARLESELRAMNSTGEPAVNLG
jgi:hypothetical protein